MKKEPCCEFMLKHDIWKHLKIWHENYNCLGRPYHLKFFKGCLLQLCLGSFLNILAHIIVLNIINIFGLGCKIYQFIVLIDNFKHAFNSWKYFSLFTWILTCVTYIVWRFLTFFANISQRKILAFLEALESTCLFPILRTQNLVFP